MALFGKTAALALAAATVLGMSVTSQAYEATTGPTGVLKYEKGKAYEGYTLFSPMMGSTTTYLIDMNGDVVHKWDCDSAPGAYAELLPNGNLLRAGTVDQAAQLKAIGKLKEDGPQKYVAIGGTGGKLQEIDWDGKVVWEYVMAEPWKEMQHHTFHRMPNGNTLLLGWEYVTKEEAKKLGRKANVVDEPVMNKGIPYEGYWMDFVREVNSKSETVWEWHAKDHLGKGADKLDFNYTLPWPVGDIYATYDWSHFNTVNYIADSDTVVLNSRNMAEFYFIDHKSGKITYRWGNPTAYDAKAKKPSYYDNGDQIAFGSHSATPLDNGNVLLFDNGSERPELRRSSAQEIDPKTNTIVWEYMTKHSNSFFSYRQGGVQRLANGNTLICSTHGGHVMEVTPEKELVWEFVSPILGGKGKCVASEADALPFSAHIDGMNNMIHRAFRYGPDYPGLKGRDLSAATPLVEGCPKFFEVYKKGATLGGAKAADTADEEEDAGPAMHAY
ncbi:MAG: aryl-sulfate sulfotransferase [Desulfopila sp.]